MKNKEYIKQKFIESTESRGIVFQDDNTVNPYDDSTLFCPAGMQQFKSKFKDESYKGTVSNIQSCIRMNDFNEIGDGSHLLSFDMLGLFSFREMVIKDAIEFWWTFIQDLNIKVDYVTIHPDKRDWHKYYRNSVEIREDKECSWTDGEIGGYCTEFFVGDLEIGNIVNPLGNSIDAGFGLDRIAMLLGDKPLSKLETLKESAIKIINSGYQPSNKLQGYVLRKVLREIYNLGGSINHSYFTDEIKRQEDIQIKYNKLKDKHLSKSKEWWYDTFGINIDEVK